MKELLASGRASVADIAAPYGLTALNLAMLYGQTEASQLLIAEGAPQIPSSSWAVSDLWEYIACCPLIESSMTVCAVVNDFVKLYAPERRADGLESCQEEVRLEAVNLSRLHKSVLRVSCEQVDSIIPACQDIIDEVDSFGRTALYWASKTDQTSVVQKLLLHGADPRISDRNGATPLHIAAGLGIVECVETLVASGAIIEAKDRLGGSPLHYACANGQLRTIRSLLYHGADCDAQNFLGETSILYAIHARQIEAVQTLVSCGASLQAVDTWGYIPVLDAAFTDSHEALGLLLLKQPNLGTRVSTERHCCILRRGIRISEQLKSC